tara:strand:+ start:4693 stop:5172 length:480 start_codon:yes stop_codon:yes gene_type:complete
MTYINTRWGKNTQAVTTENTSVQTTSTSSNSWVTINGSEISYTPDSGASNVIYEIGFYVEALNKACFQNIVLEHNTGSWSAIDVKYGRNFGSSPAGSYLRDYLYYRFIVPSWSGSRGLRLRSASHMANYAANYHAITDWDGSGSISNRFCNTSLLVYSV